MRKSAILTLLTASFLLSSCVVSKKSMRLQKLVDGLLSIVETVLQICSTDPETNATL